MSERTYPVIEVFGVTDTEAGRISAQTKLDGDCFRWTGAYGSAGYGVTWYEGKWALAHRAMYALFVAPLEAGKMIHHTCEHKWCVRPSHLRQVTPKDHAALHFDDKALVARANGIKTRKLTLEQAAEVRAKHESGVRQSTLCREFGLSPASMNDLVHGRSYV